MAKSVTRIEGLPDGLPFGTYQIELVDVETTNEETLTRTFRYVPSATEPPPEPEHEYLLVKVRKSTGGWTNESELHIASLPSVLEVSVHGKGCCCKNCPWNGDHG